MSATVLRFTGEWQGRSRPTRRSRADARAVHDARLLRAAKVQNDDWTARLLIALLGTLTNEQLQRLEFQLMGPRLDSESAVQALALVQLSTSDKSYRERVRSHLAAFAARETE